MDMFIEENCVIEVEGKKFESGGAWYTDKRIVAYVGKKVGDGIGVDRYGETSRNYVTDWHGNQIGYCMLKHRGWGFGGSKLYSIHGQIGSRSVYGVGLGEGCVFKGKFTKGE